MKSISWVLTAVLAGSLAAGCTASVPTNQYSLSPLAAPAIAPAQGNLAARLLAAHNAERAAVGVPPLRWNDALAAGAASYGPTLAGMGRLEHSPRASRPGQRENLSRHSRGTATPEQMVAGWAQEKRFFRPGIFPNISTTGNWLDVSHYTVMIWPGTTAVGCAVHRDARWDYLICRYSPPGNIDGQRVP